MKAPDFFSIRLGLGFVFRFFVIFWLFRLGVEGLLSRYIWGNGSFETDNIFLSSSVIFFILIFISLYLIYNLFSKKVTEQRYEGWSVVAIIFLVVIVGLYLFAVFNAGHLLSFSFDTFMIGQDLMWEMIY